MAEDCQDITTAADFFSCTRDTMTYSRLRGVVSDAFLDDVDPNFLYLIIYFDGHYFPVSLKIDDSDPKPMLNLTGREVEVMGLIRSTSEIISRAYLGRMLCVDGISNVKTLDGAPNPFDAPMLDLPEYNQPEELVHLGKRRIKGRVIAVWGGNEAYIQQSTGRPIRASFPNGIKMPAYDDEVEVVGHIGTDTFSILLSHAIWRPCKQTGTHERIVKDVNFDDVFRENRFGAHPINHKFNGRTLRVQGRVGSIAGIDKGRFQIEHSDKQITIDASSIPPSALEEVERGGVVEVVGTCVVDADKWQESDIFPRVRGLLLVPNLPEDIRIVARAPWLTPARTRAILLIFSGCLLVFLIWNRLLWLKAFRRGKALSTATLAQAEADMRTRERTRLAVELHDSLVQSLAGVIMELETAHRLVPEGDDQITPHLGRAEKMLRSCHADLRNCLWDLRSEALEEKDMKSAIARTLVPHVKDIALDIRFNVSRVLLSDNTTYMILRAVRELVLNGIKHGHAKHIKIAGAIENDKLLISVRDDGVGFDEDIAPGVLDGHFGLEGIRERLRNLSGTFEITGAPGKGTRAVITIPVPKGDSVQ